MNSNNDDPAPEDIAALAKSYWEEEGRPEGKAEEHWLRAEEALRQQQADALSPAARQWRN